MRNGLIADFFSGTIDQQLLTIAPPKGDEELLGLLLTSLDRFLERKVDAARIDREGELGEEVLDSMRELGLFGLVIPEQYGGLGLDIVSYGKVVARISAHCGATAVTLGAHQSIGLKAILMAGSEGQKRKWLPSLATGERIAAYCLTEAEAGSDAGALRTKMRRDGDQVVLDGEKIWITNGGIAGLFTVFAKDPNGTIRAVLVPRETPGITVGPEEKKLGIKGSSTTSVAFSNVRVPAENMIDGDGFRLAMDILNHGRASLAAGSVGPAQVLLDLARERATTRRQFGRPLASFTMVRETLADMALDLCGMQALVSLSGRLIDAGAPHQLEAAAAKIYCSTALWRIADQSLQLAGGVGYMSEYPYERMLRDARINRIFEGANGVLRLLIALKGLKGPGEELKAIAKKPLLALPRLTARAWRRMRVRAPQTDLHRAAAQQLASAVCALAHGADSALRRHGKKIFEAQADLERLANMAIECSAMAAVLFSDSADYIDAFVDRGARRVSRWASDLGRDREDVARACLRSAS